MRFANNPFRELGRWHANVGLLMLAAGLWISNCSAVAQTVLRVGPNLEFGTVAAAARAAKDGDVIEIEAGDYRRDVAIWTQKDLTIRGVGGRARLIADGAAVEGKGTWVIRGGRIVVENIEFTGSRVSDRNGAGIRFERGHLIIRNCVFRDNENGILTGGDRNSEIEIDSSEFGHNGAGDGQSHNLYVSDLRRLRVTNSYFHHANVGHLLKSRAGENHILYNRFTDGHDGTASYELEFPSGGVAYVIGNVIQQSPRTENMTLVSFGAEGYKWPRNELYLSHNTLANDRIEGANFLFVRAGATRVKAVNNLLVGKGSLESGPGEYAANFNVDPQDVAGAAQQDYRLRKSSGIVGKGIDPGVANGVSLRPTREPLARLRSRPIERKGPLSPGAFQTVAR